MNAKEQATLVAKKLASQAKIMKKFGSTESNPDGGRIASSSVSVDYYPTGLPVFDDEVLGIGGIPKGTFIEVYGVKSSGKSALTMFLAGQVQKQDPTAIVKIYDIEASWTDAWGESMGLDRSRVVLPEIWGAENVSAQIHADLASEFPPEIIIIDSLAMLVPEKQMEKEVGDYSMRDNLARASFLTSFFTSLTGGFNYPRAGANGKLPKESRKYKLSQTPTTILCVNHAKERTKSANGMTWTEWYSVGGVASDFASKIQLMVKKVGFEKTGTIVTHQRIKVSADKNKLAPPKKSCEILLDFKGGMEQLGSIDYVALALERGIISVKGGWIKGSFLPGEKIQGKDNFNEYVRTTPEVLKLITGK